MESKACPGGGRGAKGARLFALAVLLLVLLPMRAAHAGDNDADVRSLIRDIYKGEVSAGRHQNALDSLVVARVVCEGDACSKRVRAELEVAIGTLQALLGKRQQAEKTFAKALKLDEHAKLRASHREGKVAEAWEAATGPAEPTAPSDCRAKGVGARPPSGWDSAEAHACYRAGMDAQQDEAWGRCQHAARVSLQIEARPGSHALLARCLEADGIWTEAIEQWETAAQAAASDRQSTLSATAKHHAAALRKRQPKLVLQPPKEVTDLVVELDGTELPAAALGGELPLDPGEHQIAARGNRDGLPVSFEQSVTLEPEQSITVLLTPVPGSSDPATQELLKCLADGGDAEDCLDDDTPSALKLTLGAELSGYHDDMHVDVVTPSSHAAVEHTTDGWGVNAAFLVDVVTAASVDIVATASPRFQEVRYVPSLGGHKKFGDVDVSLSGSLSHEPDYLATSVGGSVAVDLLQKQVVPSLGYEYSHDIAGRAETPFSVFSHLIDRHAVLAGVGVSLDKATFGSLDYTMVFEDGDQSKPYRHVPMFDAAAAAGVEPGLTIDAVNEFRAPERPLEQLPTSRARFALAASLAHRFSGSTLRGDERIYVDTWGTKATTTDARYIIDLPEDFRIWPHLRVHAQTAADFYELAYVVERTASGVRLPAYRTGDRELGPLLGLSGGGGVHWDFGPHEILGLGFNGDVTYTRFLDHLFVKERLGLFGALSFEAVIE